MRYNLLILYIFLIPTGCSTVNIFTKENNIDIPEKKYFKEKIIYEKFIAKGVVKFNVKNEKVSSRFKFIKNKNIEEIIFLDIFNNAIVTFEIKKDSIKIKESNDDINSDALTKIMNREIFKKIITNFSNIITGEIEKPIFLIKYSNGLKKIIKNDIYEVKYKRYNKELLPTIMEIDFFNITFNLKIIDWVLIK